MDFYSTAWLVRAAAFLMAVATVCDQVDAGIIEVQSTAAPWNWVAGGLNDAFQFGIQDNSAPATAGTNPGDTLTITYLSGLTSPYGNLQPYADANGDITYVANNFGGSSNSHFPSFFIDPGSYPAYLNALIGVFTNSTGQIVGTPFLIGNGPVTEVTPFGATQLQLGINDDIFGDNSGSLFVEVSGSTSAAVPEPSSFTLLGLGGIGLAVAAYCRRQQNTAV